MELKNKYITDFLNEHENEIFNSSGCNKNDVAKLKTNVIKFIEAGNYNDWEDWDGYYKVAEFARNRLILNGCDTIGRVDLMRLFLEQHND